MYLICTEKNYIVNIDKIGKFFGGRFMNVFMIGGTGLLGCEAAIELIKHGHKVTSVALPPLPEGAPIPEEMELIFGDINKKTDEEIEQLLKGNDVFIFAAGVD